MTTDTTTTAADRTDAAPSDGWFGLVEGEIAHCVESISGSNVKSLCMTDRLNAWTPTSATRPVRAGDEVCRACVVELVRVGDAPDLSLAECLGCRRLHERNPKGGVAEHPDPDIETDTDDGTDGAVPCRGSGIRPASHDGLDDVRADALVNYVSLTRDLDALREEYVTALREWKPGNAIGYWSARIARVEGTAAMWEKLIISGRLFDVVAQAVIASARRHTGSDEFEGGVIRARAEGAKDWLRGVNWRVLGVLAEREKDPVYKAFSEIFYGL